MAAASPLDDRLVEIAEREVLNFRKTLEGFKQREYPHAIKGPSELILLLDSIADLIVAETRERISKQKDLPAQARPGFLYAPLQLLGFLHRRLEFIDGAETKNNPYGIVIPLVQILEGIHTNFGIALKPQWEFMYSCLEIGERLRKLTEEAFPTKSAELLKDFPARFWVLTYPASHRTDILMYAVMGHELGHVFDKAYSISTSALLEIDPQKHNLENLVTTLAQQELGPPPAGFPDLFLHTVVDQKKAELRDRISRTLTNWLSEIVCDCFAVVTFGPAYFFAVTRFFSEVGSLTEWNEGYPTALFRIGLMLKELESLGFSERLNGLAAKEVSDWRTALEASTLPTGVQGVQSRTVLESCVRDATPFIAQQVRQHCSQFSYKLAVYDSEVSSLVMGITELVPPIEVFCLADKKTRPPEIPSILNAGWIAYVNCLDSLAKSLGYDANQRMGAPLEVLNNFIARAIELNPVCRKFYKKEDLPRSPSMLWDRMFVAPNESQNQAGQRKRLVITPVLSKEIQISHLAIDVRLSGEFIVPKKTKFPAIDVHPKGPFAEARVELQQDKIYCGFLGKQSHFVLHPSQFALGSTLEYVKIPDDMLAYVIGRSSLGRLGLTIATATVGSPGYAGVLTLELVNHGETPIVLYPGQRIGQLQFHVQDPTVEPYVTRRVSKYRCPIGPEFSKIRLDSDWDEEFFK